MDAVVVPLAVMCSLGLAGVALSVAAMFQAGSSVRRLDCRTRARDAQFEAAFEAAQQAMKGLAQQVDQLRKQSPAPPARRSLNVTTRSQALRMHRRGDTPERIAAALEIPVQEVELLLRVHRIVLNHLIVTPKPATALERAPSA
jgi:hypothetical protein